MARKQRNGREKKGLEIWNVEGFAERRAENANATAKQCEENEEENFGSRLSGCGAEAKNQDFKLIRTLQTIFRRRAFARFCLED